MEKQHVMTRQSVKVIGAVSKSYYRGQPLPTLPANPRRHLECSPRHVSFPHRISSSSDPPTPTLPLPIQCQSGVVFGQEVCLEEEQVLDWPGRQTNSRFYLSGGKDKKLGTGFIVRGKMQDRVFGFTAISERSCKLRIRGRFFNYSIINVHCPHEEKTDDEKEAFYATLEEVYEGCPRQDVKMNARFGREEMFRPTIGPESLHAVTNDNGQRCIDFAASRGMVVRNTYFPCKDIHKATWTTPDQRTKTQIDHVLIDGRFFSNITHVRTFRGANIDSDHYLVGFDMRSKLSTVYNQRRRAPPFNTTCLQNGDVAHSYAQQLEANLPGEEELGAASLEGG
ncbi:uncharacterized protein LOC119770363 [Culex quinquefasciatus]|uniref:uncharacterized protein LOC119770363 n=1 Tax=Culex quinquefasciatus TaxID=7176 RepID=UPI0018E35B2B|nr:uncharacterized protein LOC119770363 [Culex quinquefasciatus]